jgi:hypothetical protein
MRYVLTGNEWVAIKPMLPNKPRKLRSGYRACAKLTTRWDSGI